MLSMRVMFVMYRSGLEQEDMRVLYCYLTGNLLPGYVASELQGGESSRVAQGHYGK